MNTRGKFNFNVKFVKTTDLPKTVFYGLKYFKTLFDNIRTALFLYISN